MSAIEMQLAPGMRVGSSPWILQRRLGAGAFGEVWAVQHEHTLAIAAVKILKAIAVGVGEKSKTLQDKILNAARLLVRVSHPNVVRVFDAGYLGGEPHRQIWVVMELLEGRELTKVLHEEGPLPPSRALRYIDAVASAVATVHAVATEAEAAERAKARAEAAARNKPDPYAGARPPAFAHRDLKPDNLFVQEGRSGDQIKVLDFDMAHMPRAKTMVGQRIGTPYYMSPEQYAGKDLDSRSDVWALGVILYEMVVGKKPFDGANIGELIAAVMRQPLPTPDRPLPPEVWQLIVQATTKDRASRPTIDDFATRTQRLCQDVSSASAGIQGETARLSSSELSRAIASSTPGQLVAAHSEPAAGQTILAPGPILVAQGSPLERSSTKQTYTSDAAPLPAAPAPPPRLNVATAVAVALGALVVATAVVVAVTATMRSEPAPAAASSEAVSEPTSKASTTPPEASAPPATTEVVQPEETAPTASAAETAVPSEPPPPPPTKAVVPPPPRPRPVPPPPPKDDVRW